MQAISAILVAQDACCSAVRLTESMLVYKECCKGHQQVGNSVEDAILFPADKQVQLITACNVFEA